MRRYTALLVVALLAVATPVSVSAQIFSSKKKEALPDYKRDDRGNIIVSKVLENLDADVKTLYEFAHEYIQESYQETKYEFIIEQPEKGVVAGRGRYENFYLGSGVLYSYNLCCNFILRVDIKDGRMRLSAMADKYSGTERNINIAHELDDKIVETRPFVDDNPDLGMDRERAYNKAFPMLLLKMKATLNELEAFINEKAQAIVNDDW